MALDFFIYFYIIHRTMGSLHESDIPENPPFEEDSTQIDNDEEDDLLSDSDFSEAESNGSFDPNKKKKKKKVRVCNKHLSRHPMILTSTHRSLSLSLSLSFSLQKKKKNKNNTDTSSSTSSPTKIDPALKKRAEEKFKNALKLLSSNDEDSMWVQLTELSLTDTKLNQIQKALESNTVILSLDLSKNNLTDTGACALAEQLAHPTAAPNLIELVVKDNAGIGERGTTALGNLAAIRKSLRVELGTEKAEVPQEVHNNEKEKGMSNAARNSAVVRKYFQVGNDDDDDDTTGLHSRQNGQQPTEDEDAVDPEQLAIELWDQLMSAVDGTPPLHIPLLSAPLRAIVDHVEIEMTNCVLPMLPDTTKEDLKPFSRTSLSLLPILSQVLAVQPPPIPTTYSRQHPVPSVGSHRQAAVELIAQLLRSQCPMVVEQTRSLIPCCIDLAVNHPNCSAVHCSVLKSSTEPALPGMWSFDGLERGGHCGEAGCVGS